MARMPGAIWKPLAADWNRQPRMRAYDFFCVHTMVGSLVGTDGYFRVGNGSGYGGTESHFGVGPDGTIYQWQDTDFQADANGNGNWHVISSENADTGFPFPKWGGSDVPPLTGEQVEANARIAAWLWQTHRIPLDIAGSSKPGARGLSVHRYGVPGYAPAGAELWSSAKGKACPGDRRIAQLPAIRDRAKQITSGSPAAKPTPQQEEDDMFDVNDRGLLRDLHTMLGAFKGGAEKDFYQPFFAEAAAKGTAQQFAALTGSLNAIAELLRKGAGGDGFTVDQAVAAGRAGADEALAELGDKLRTT